MESESSASIIRRAMQHHVRKCPSEGAAVARWSGASAPEKGAIGWISHGWARTWAAISMGLRIARTTLWERVRPKRVELQRLERAVESICANLDSLHGRIHELESRTAPATPGQGTMSLNLSTKSQAMKLFRGGQDARQIARTLGLAIGEIELLLKVQRMQSRVEAHGKEWREEVNSSSAAKCEGAATAQKASGLVRPAAADANAA